MLYTQRIDVLVEDHRMNDVFLFLAQGVPLLDVASSYAAPALYQGTSKRERWREKDGISRWRATRRRDREVGGESKPRLCKTLSVLKPPSSSLQRVAQVVPTNAASFSSTGQKSKVKIPKSASPPPLPSHFFLAAFHLHSRNRFTLRKMSEVDGALKRIHSFTALYQAKIPFLNYDLDMKNVFRSSKMQ